MFVINSSPSYLRAQNHAEKLLGNYKSCNFFISADTVMCSLGGKHYETKIFIFIRILPHHFVIVMQNIMRSGFLRWGGGGGGGILAISI